MEQHFKRALHRLTSRAQAHRPLAIIITGIFIMCIALGGSALATTQSYGSPEVHFTDASRSGLAIVPASCPSTPDPGEACSACGPARPICGPGYGYVDVGTGCLYFYTSVPYTCPSGYQLDGTQCDNVSAACTGGSSSPSPSPSSPSPSPSSPSPSPTPSTPTPPPPAPPQPITGLSATCNNTSGIVTLSWSASPGASYYETDVADPSAVSCPSGWLGPDSSGECYIWQYRDGTSISATFTPGHTYSAYINAGSDAGGYGGFYGPQGFACPAPAQECPFGSTWNGSQCVTASCPAGYVSQGDSCVPVVCPTGYQWNGSQCFKSGVCPDGSAPVGGICSSPGPVCPSGYQWNGKLCVSGIVCPLGYTLSGTNCVFSACPAGYTLSLQGTCQLSQCTPQNVCGADGNLYTESASCNVSGSPTQVCSYGCEGNACLPPPAPKVVKFAVSPSLIPRNSQATIKWEVENVTACTVKATNGDIWSQPQSTATWTDSEMSSLITAQTIYTLHCSVIPGAQNLDGTPATWTDQTATVNIVPNFQEN